MFRRHPKTPKLRNPLANLNITPIFCRIPCFWRGLVFLLSSLSRYAIWCVDSPSGANYTQPAFVFYITNQALWISSSVSSHGAANPNLPRLTFHGKAGFLEVRDADFGMESQHWQGWVGCSVRRNRARDPQSLFSNIEHTKAGCGELE